jgi:glycosyltransferase involved in cell wall biosynthesis
MRIVHTVAATNESLGGPSRSVVGLCEALARSNAGVSLVTTDLGGDCGKPLLPGAGCEVTLIPRRQGLLGECRVAAAFGRAISHSLGGDATGVVNDHGVWRTTNIVAARAARRHAVPLVIHTRGMLMRWSLRHHSWRKRVALSLYQRRILCGAQLLVATSQLEAEELTQEALRVPVAIIPNGIALPPPAPRVLGDGPRRALFLSRLHPKKGAQDLIEAWARLKPEGWTLWLAGPDEDGYRAQLEQQAAARGILSAIQFLGPVDEASKWRVYSQADLFVLPTYSENFGMVIGEALASAVPVITTTAAPWQAVADEQCGWCIAPGADSLEAALRVALAVPTDELASMGGRGRVFVAREYSWERVARDTLLAYRWALGSLPRPDFVLAT